MEGQAEEWLTIPLHSIPADRAPGPPPYSLKDGEPTWCECGKHLWYTLCPERLQDQSDTHHNLSKIEGRPRRTWRQRLAGRFRQTREEVIRECLEFMDEFSVRTRSWLGRRPRRPQVIMSPETPCVLASSAVQFSR
jgi:hypothetical protein